MSNLEELLDKLGDEPTPEVDWDAPEAGSFPPSVRPGIYEFVFKLREDTPFEQRDIQGHPYLGILFDADVMVDGETRTITYQRANTYKHEKVPMSSIAELARSLNLRPDDYTNRSWVRLFQSASGRARGRGEVAWRFYDKAADVTFSTSPRRRKNQAGVKVKDTAWPRNPDGTFADTVLDSAGQKQYGQAEFIRFYSPAASETATA